MTWAGNLLNWDTAENMTILSYWASSGNVSGLLKGNLPPMSHQPFLLRLLSVWFVTMLVKEPPLTSHWPVASQEQGKPTDRKTSVWLVDSWRQADMNTWTHILICYFWDINKLISCHLGDQKCCRCKTVIYDLDWKHSSFYNNFVFWFLYCTILNTSIH